MGSVVVVMGDPVGWFGVWWAGEKEVRVGELYRWAVAEQAPEVVDFEALDVREPEEVAPEGEEPLDWVETLEAAEALGFELDGESYWVYQGGAQAMCCGGRTMGLEAGSLGEAVEAALRELVGGAARVEVRYLPVAPNPYNNAGWRVSGRRGRYEARSLVSSDFDLEGEVEGDAVRAAAEGLEAALWRELETL
ncbi:MAG: hypothetical protein CMH59_02295 [Myxococcales bacterium]|nr:hypothetical protein [Myxococcales bacterium]